MSGKTDVATRASGTKAACTAKAPSPGPTAASTKVISRTTFAKVSASTNGRMAAYTAATGCRARWTVRARTFQKMAKSSKATGRMVKDNRKRRRMRTRMVVKMIKLLKMAKQVRMDKLVRMAKKARTVDQTLKSN